MTQTLGVQQGLGSVFSASGFFLFFWFSISPALRWKNQLLSLWGCPFLVVVFPFLIFGGVEMVFLTPPKYNAQTLFVPTPIVGVVTKPTLGF